MSGEVSDISVLGSNTKTQMGEDSFNFFSESIKSLILAPELQPMSGMGRQNPDSY